MKRCPQTREWNEAVQYPSMRQKYLDTFLALHPWMDVERLEYMPLLSEVVRNRRAKDRIEDADVTFPGAQDPDTTDYALGIIPWSTEHFGRRPRRVIYVGKETFESVSDTAELEIQYLLQHDLYKQATGMLRGFNFPPHIDSVTKEQIRPSLLPALLRLFTTKEFLMVSASADLAHTGTFKAMADTYLNALSQIQGTSPFTDTEYSVLTQAPILYPPEIGGATMEEILQSMGNPRFVM